MQTCEAIDHFAHHSDRSRWPIDPATVSAGLDGCILRLVAGCMLAGDLEAARDGSDLEALLSEFCRGILDGTYSASQWDECYSEVYDSLQAWGREVDAWASRVKQPSEVSHG